MNHFYALVKGARAKKTDIIENDEVVLLPDGSTVTIDEYYEMQVG